MAQRGPNLETMPRATEPFVKARIPADIKSRVDETLRREGLTQQQAIEMVWRAIDARGGFPWEIKSSSRKADAAE